MTLLLLFVKYWLHVHLSEITDTDTKNNGR